MAKHRSYFSIEKESTETECTLSINEKTPDTVVQYKKDTESSWSEVPDDGCKITSTGVTNISFKAVPNDTIKAHYEEYQIDVTITYVEEYQIDTTKNPKIINVTNEQVTPSTTLVFDNGRAYFEKCGYCGYKIDSHGKYGKYANPARYETTLVKHFDMVQHNVLPMTVAGSRTSIINFYDSNNQKIEEIMIRGKGIDAKNKNEYRIFPSDSDPNGIMTIKKSSNYSFDPSDINLSNLFKQTGIQANLTDWYYVVNGIQKRITNILNYSFPWQAALTDVHKKYADPTCSDQIHHYAIYNLYPSFIEKSYKVEFYDAYGNHLSNQTGPLSDWSEYTYEIDYQKSVYPPTNLKAIKEGKTLLFHSGWIDTTDGLQANLAEVTHDMKCIPFYSQSIKDTNGIIETDDLKKYMVDLIQMQCDNVDEFYVSHEYYKPEYSRAYGNLKRAINAKSFKYLSHVSTSTLEKNVSDYMHQVDVLLDEYKDKVMTMGLVFLYYLAILYFIKNTVVYVHGYKHESLGDYNSCHVMYVPDNVPDFESYIKNFSLIQDTIDILIDCQDQYDIIYDYSMIV